jgi:hypothetical protein
MCIFINKYVALLDKYGENMNLEGDLSNLDSLLPMAMLTRALSCDEMSDTSWLSSSFIDLILSKFAKEYKDCHFMPIEFAAFRLKSMQTEDMLQVGGCVWLHACLFFAFTATTTLPSLSIPLPLLHLSSKGDCNKIIIIT